MAYLTASDGKRITVDPQIASAFRGQRVGRLNSRQYRLHGQNEALSRTILRRSRCRIPRASWVICLNGPRDLRLKHLVIIPANSSVLHGSGIKKTRCGHFEARINYRYRSLWGATFATYRAALRARNRMLRHLGFVY